MTLAGAPLEGSGYAVLIAENSPAVTMMVRTLLTRWGFAVTAARCDDQALAALAQSRFDMVIIGATAAGATAVAEACAQRRGAPIPFVALVTPGHRLASARQDLTWPTTGPNLRQAVWQCLRTGAEPLDAAAIAALWGGPANPIFHRIVRVFIPEARRQLQRIQERAAAGDWHATEVEAHALKGAAANVGAHAIRDAAARIEAEAARDDPASLPALLNALCAVTEPGIMALQRLVAADPGVA